MDIEKVTNGGKNFISALKNMANRRLNTPIKKYPIIIFPDDIVLDNGGLNKLMSLVSNYCIDHFLQGDAKIKNRCYSEKSISVLFHNIQFDSLLEICNKFKVVLGINNFLLYNPQNDSFYLASEKE